MFYLAIFLITSHILCDFYIQNKRMVVCKSGVKGVGKFIKYHVIHALIHSVGFYIAYYLWVKAMSGNFNEMKFNVILLACFFGLSHLVVDLIKEIFKKNISVKYDLFLFVLDQIIHLICIFLFIFIASLYGMFVFDKVKVDNINLIATLVLLFVSLLTIIRPVSFFVEKFLKVAMSGTKITHINLTKSHFIRLFDEGLKKNFETLINKESCSDADIEKALKTYDKNTKAIISEYDKLDISIDTSDVFTSNKGGLWIGYIERIMIFTFYMFGQFTAIAAVIAIKTAFRFNDLKDDNDSHRSEYIMLGTFVSLFSTLLISIVVKHFIKLADFSKAIDPFIKSFM